MMDPVVIQTILINNLAFGFLPSIPKIFKIKSTELELECRERITSNYQWVKFLK